jgi:uncharacterized protein (TIGR02147 family)
MTEQSLIQDILVQEYRHAKARNPSFSQRAFAKRLGLSSGAMSSIFNGKRKISKQMALRLLESLGADPVQKDQVMLEFGPKNSTSSPIKRSTKERQLSMDQFEIIADGIHFSLLCLMETKDFESCPKYMAKRLGKSIKEVKTALKRLERLQLLTLDKEGNYTYQPVELTSPDEIISSSLKQSHVESMQDAKESLFRDPISSRDFTSQTIAISTEKIGQAKELIRRFNDELAELMDGKKSESDHKNEVYKINIQFFPMTREIS